MLIGELNCLWPQTQTLADLLHGGDDRLCLAASLAAPLLLRLLIDQIGSDDAQRERLLGCGEDAHDHLQQAAIVQAGLQQLTGGQLCQFVRGQVNMSIGWGDAFLCFIGCHRLSPPLPVALVPIRITLRPEKRSSRKQNEERPDSAPAFYPTGRAGGESGSSTSASVPRPNAAL